MTKNKMHEDEFVKTIKKVLWDYRECNLQSFVVRERIANEIRVYTRKAVCKEQEDRLKDVLINNKR